MCLLTKEHCQPKHNTIGWLRHIALTMMLAVHFSIEIDLDETRDRWISLYERLCQSLYVLAMPVSTPRRKVWIFQSFVVRDVIHVGSIRY